MLFSAVQTVFTRCSSQSTKNCRLFDLNFLVVFDQRQHILGRLVQIARVDSLTLEVMHEGATLWEARKLLVDTFPGDSNWWAVKERKCEDFLSVETFHLLFTEQRTEKKQEEKFPNLIMSCCRAGKLCNKKIS